jgi:intracellular septation protein
MSKKSYEGITKFLCDYLPIIVFFICYKFIKTPDPLITATIFMIVATIFAMIVSYILNKKIPMMALASALMLGLFGGLTIILKDEIFIKMKPTIINSLFAAILLYGYFTKKLFLSHFFGEKIQMSNQAWLNFSLRWAGFFIFLAILNEIIWRCFSTDFWVQFKVFGMTPISLIFTASQLPFIMREMKKFEHN